VSILSFQTFRKWFSIQKDYLLASSKNIGVHDSTLEHAPTADISTTPPSSQLRISHTSHAIWKEFLKAVFSSNIIKILESSKGRSIEEKERESTEKRERKRKAPRVSSNKKGKSMFWEEKNIATSKSFLCQPIFLSSIIPFQKPFPKSFEIFL
jgi:hypothetical protein